MAAAPGINFFSLLAAPAAVIYSPRPTIDCPANFTSSTRFPHAPKLKMRITDYAPTSRLCRSYILALAVIACLLLSGQGLIQYSLWKQERGGEDLQLLSRGRVLWQQLTKSALAVSRESDQPGRAPQAEELRGVLVEWGEFQRALQDDSWGQGIAASYAAEVRSSLLALEPHCRAMSEVAHELLRLVEHGDRVRGRREARINELADALLAEDPAFRQGLEQVLTYYAQASIGHFRWLRVLGLGLVCRAEGTLAGGGLYGDPYRLRQVLVNLVGNAIKFTECGEVELSVVIEESFADGVRCRFSVRDTGIGIPREKHGLIFESFTQADGSTTRQYGGTGLGLAISKQLVELMGGALGVESEPGVGSTFSFVLTFGRGQVPSPPVDLVELKRCVAGDEGLLRELVVAFLADAPVHLARLCAAFDASDAAAVRYEVHTLKDVGGTIRAKALQRLCGALEKIGAECWCAEAEELLAGVKAELARVSSYLQSEVGGA